MTAAETTHVAHPPKAPAGDGAGTLQGMIADLLNGADEAARNDILEKAFDFRGDCTLTLKSGREVTGYIFDRVRVASGAESFVRLMCEGSDEKVRVGYAEVAKVGFGKDAAHGKTFENWVKRYVEKKMKGEKASIESEAL